jgi:hypothetical protein
LTHNLVDRPPIRFLLTKPVGGVIMSFEMES